MSRLIYFSGYLAQGPFGADVAEIDREYPGQLFHHMIYRGDITVQKPRNILLEDVGIADMHPTQSELNYQCRDKGF